MKLTIDFDISDKNGTPLAVGDIVEFGGARRTIASFIITAAIDYFTSEVEDEFVKFKDGGSADPMYCTKVPTTAERIEAVLNDTDLTDGEALDEILRIIGHERKW